MAGQFGYSWSDEELAREMILRGFKNAIIVRATLLQSSRVRKIRSQIAEEHNDDGFLEASIGHIRQSNRIVSSRAAVAHAGLIVAYYLMIVQDRYASVNFEALICAYDYYLEVKEDHFGHKELIKPDEAYALIRDLRCPSQKIFFETCNNSGCGITYIVVENMLIEPGCPMCPQIQAAGSTRRRSSSKACSH